jgi:hypothetical protein
MKPYLITTGTLFALVAVAHLLRTIAEWSRLTTDPGFILEGPGLGVLAAAIALWAGRLLAKRAYAG